MAKEAIERVKNSERIAENAEQEAKDKAREIIDKAKSECKDLLDKAVSAAENQADINRADAKKQADELMTKAKEQAELNSKEFFDNSQKKKDTVIAEIISSLV